MIILKRFGVIHSPRSIYNVRPPLVETDDPAGRSRGDEQILQRAALVIPASRDRVAGGARRHIGDVVHLLAVGGAEVEPECADLRICSDWQVVEDDAGGTGGPGRNDRRCSGLDPVRIHPAAGGEVHPLAINSGGRRQHRRGRGSHSPLNYRRGCDLAGDNSVAEVEDAVEILEGAVTGGDAGQHRAGCVVGRIEFLEDGSFDEVQPERAGVA